LVAIAIAAATTGCDLYFEDSPAERECSVVVYRVAELSVPASSEEADAVATDVDGDGQRDNQLAQAFVDIARVTSWAAAAEPNPQAAWRLEVRTCGDSVEVGLGGGASSPITRGTGEMRDDGFIATGGIGSAPLGRIVDPAGADGWVGAYAPVVSGRRDGLELSGKLAFGIHAPELEQVVLPALGGGMTRAAAEDPDCDDRDCWFYDWDSSLDGVIADWEVLLRPEGAPLAEPDLDLFDPDGAYGADGTADAHSLSVRYRAIVIEAR
jgi:hypothetical protein